MTHRNLRYRLSGCAVAIAAGLVGYAHAGVAAPGDTGALQLAQALPTPLPPVANVGGDGVLPNEQYIVLISGSSDLLLQQVQQIEPGAFVNLVNGRSVIQAGRFNSFQNAQLRANELATIGIGAQIQSATPLSSSVPVRGVPDPAIASVSPTGGLPPIPVAAAPSSVAFGQEPPVAVVPPPVASPGPTNTALPPTSGVPSSQPSRPAGYYVVVPGRAAELTGLANQVVGLGASPSLVQARTNPRGPHIAIGPYDDHGIAREWSRYLRDSGLDARVHFE